jgi:hypothetical protein
MNDHELKILKKNIKEKIIESTALTKETHEILVNKKNDFKGQLKKCSKLKDELIMLYRQILGEYNIWLEANASSKELKLIYTYVEGARVHINLQQDDCNQLRYEIQQSNNKSSISIARIALGATFVLSILSIFCSYFDCKYHKEDFSYPIKCLSDSIKHLNGKIKQQNEIIEKYFSLQRNDSIISPNNTNQ